MRAPVLAVGDGALGVLEGCARRVPADPGAALRVPQDRERAGCPAEVRPPLRQEGARGDHQRREQGPRAGRREGVLRRVRRPVPQGRGEDHRRPRRARVLRLSRRTRVHLRTTNPIGSAFATVRLRQRVTKGPGSRAAGIAMAFKLLESAERRWRAVNAPHLVALVRAGAQFTSRTASPRQPSRGGDLGFEHDVAPR